MGAKLKKVKQESEYIYPILPTNKSDCKVHRNGTDYKSGTLHACRREDSRRFIARNSETTWVDTNIAFLFLWEPVVEHVYWFLSNIYCWERNQRRRKKMCKKSDKNPLRKKAVVPMSDVSVIGPRLPIQSTYHTYVRVFPESFPRAEKTMYFPM
jgi:hypothetical protein